MSSFKKKIRKKRKNEGEKIAKERIRILFNLAEEKALEGDMEKANDYVARARKIGMKTNVRIAKELKRKFCKYCYSYLLPGKTSQVRINSKNKRVIVKCQNCKRESYFPYVKEKKKRRENAPHN